MYPGHWSKVAPDKPAVIMGASGETITYAELDARSNQLAQLLWSRGLRPGDGIAVLLENHPRYFEVLWAALQSGLYLTTVNRHLTAAEAAYIINDSDAGALITSASIGADQSTLLGSIPACKHRLVMDADLPGFESYEAAVAAQAESPLAAEPRGDFLIYSSGTTGRPKGIKRPLSGEPVSRGLSMNPIFVPLFGLDPDTTYLSTAPLYFMASLGFCAVIHSVGGTAVVMERFDAQAALQLIEQHRITHSQWVPTMFWRMLKLPDHVRADADVSSLKVAVHAAAPCPRQVKQQMFDWWGPIIHEYYGGSEFNGLTYANPEAWLAHPGTVGRPVFGVLHICSESGDELPAGEDGLVYFEMPKRPFEYLKDPAATQAATHPVHPNWTTLGDIGHVDEDGFLYLTDRATFMIISGGVNIYPQEIENCLVMHPKVADVAVIGVPHAEMGEEVKAVVQLADGVEPAPGLEQELIDYTRDHLSHYKCPRSVDFEPDLPREATGKLYKRHLRDRYWQEHKTHIL